MTDYLANLDSITDYIATMNPDLRRSLIFALTDWYEVQDSHVVDLTDPGFSAALELETIEHMRVISAFMEAMTRHPGYSLRAPQLGDQASAPSQIPHDPAAGY